MQTDRQRGQHHNHTHFQGKAAWTRDWQPTYRRDGSPDVNCTFPGTPAIIHATQYPRRSIISGSLYRAEGGNAVIHGCYVKGDLEEC